MINAVGRDIPEALLVNGKEVYQGKYYMDGKYLQKAAPRTRRYEKPQETKIVESIAAALKACGAKDGMTFSFHHHLRNGDYVANMVMKAAIEELGPKDLTIAATSLGDAHDPYRRLHRAGQGRRHPDLRHPRPDRRRGFPRRAEDPRHHPLSRRPSPCHRGR